MPWPRPHSAHCVGMRGTRERGSAFGGSIASGRSRGEASRRGPGPWSEPTRRAAGTTAQRFLASCSVPVIRAVTRVAVSGRERPITVAVQYCLTRRGGGRRTSGERRSRLAESGLARPGLAAAIRASRWAERVTLGPAPPVGGVALRGLTVRRYPDPQAPPHVSGPKNVRLDDRAREKTGQPT